MENNEKSSKKLIVIVAVISAIVGALIMLLLNMFVFNKNKTVASIKGFKVSKVDLYEKAKNEYGLSYALEEIDNQILNKKYKLTDEMKKEINEEAEQYLKTYLEYGYTEEQFLEMYGFKNKDEFIKDIGSSYIQKLYYTDYLAGILGEDAVKAYYETDNVYGPINCKHILVETGDNAEAAKKLATTIIGELNSGATWDEIIEKYAEKITTEELGYQGIDNTLESSFMDALKSLENDSYSKEPVETSYGYHIIYRMDQQDKPSYEEARKDIITILGKDLEAEDSYLSYKAFMDLEQEYGLKIKDKDLKKQYEEFCNSIKGE